MTFTIKLALLESDKSGFLSRITTRHWICKRISHFIVSLWGWMLRKAPRLPLPGPYVLCNHCLWVLAPSLHGMDVIQGWGGVTLRGERVFCRCSEDPSPTDFELIQEGSSWTDLNKFSWVVHSKQQSVSGQPSGSKPSWDLPTIRELEENPELQIRTEPLLSPSLQTLEISRRLP